VKRKLREPGAEGAVLHDGLHGLVRAPAREGEAVAVDLASLDFEADERGRHGILLGVERRTLLVGARREPGETD
jgi:hypothetical protein